MTPKEIIDAHPKLPGYDRDAILSLTTFGLIYDAFEDPRYSNPPEYVNVLIDGLESGTVETELVPLPDPPPFNEPLRWEIFSGQTHHQRVCSSVALWLDGQGRTWRHNQSGCSCPGGIADLRSSDGRLVVEVGNTNVCKIIDCLESGLQVLMVPYVTCGLFGILLTPHLEKGHVDTLIEFRRQQLIEAATKIHTPYVPDERSDDLASQKPTVISAEKESRMKKRAEARRQERARAKADHPEFYCTVSGCFRRPSGHPFPGNEGLCYSCATRRAEAKLL